MRMYLISDNIDTQMGLRLAGIEGVVVHEKEALKHELTEAINNKEIGIILLTSKIFNLDREYIQDLKLNLPSPLIVEISDRHKSHEVQSMIDETISKIIGEVV
ncbi:V-type ATP synthase subunit F [Erysipelothrix tonsillarum]|uniref:V-type ATP synthase subunit F n=1 Tax=Erysipelothrix tonsillarum TaxID=38402 RepID=UPI00047568A0|nr:V-type ATP synthase subunit F [Erysipelothrix tonsillarum]